MKQLSHQFWSTVKRFTLDFSVSDNSGRDFPRECVTALITRAVKSRGRNQNVNASKPVSKNIVMKIWFLQQKKTQLFCWEFNPGALNMCQIISKNMSEIGNVIAFRMKKCTQTLRTSRSTSIFLSRESEGRSSKCVWYENLLRGKLTFKHFSEQSLCVALW